MSNETPTPGTAMPVVVAYYAEAYEAGVTGANPDDVLWSAVVVRRGAMPPRHDGQERIDESCPESRA